MRLCPATTSELHFGAATAPNRFFFLWSTSELKRKLVPWGSVRRSQTWYVISTGPISSLSVAFVAFSCTMQCYLTGRYELSGLTTSGPYRAVLANHRFRWHMDNHGLSLVRGKCGGCVVMRNTILSKLHEAQTNLAARLCVSTTNRS